MESLSWASPKFKIVRSMSHNKPYIGPVNFKKVKRQINPVEFVAKHQFELVEDDDELVLDQPPSTSQGNQSTNERI